MDNWLVDDEVFYYPMYTGDYIDNVTIYGLRIPINLTNIAQMEMRSAGRG